MRKLLTGVMVACLLAITSIGYCNEWRDLNTRAEKSGLTTPIHIGVGIAVSATVYHCLPDSMNPILRKGAAFMAPVVVGTIKEMTDRNFDINDIGGYAAGSAISITIMTIDF